MSFESYKKHETDPKEVDRYVAISEALGKLDMNGQIEVSEEFKGIIDQNAALEDESGKKKPPMTSEDKMSILLQMIEEQRKKPVAAKGEEGTSAWSLELEEHQNDEENSQKPLHEKHDPFPTSRPSFKWNFPNSRILKATVDRNPKPFDRNDLITNIEVLIERSEVKKEKKMLLEKMNNTAHSDIRRSKGPPEKRPMNKELDRRTVREPGAILNEAEIHDSHLDLMAEDLPSNE